MRPILLATLALFALPLTGCNAAQRMATDAIDAAATAQTRSNADWTTNASEFRDQIGRRYAYACPPGGAPSTVWGTGPYTDDSSVCTAAVHAGAASFSRGGRVVIEMRDGQASYPEGRRNGVDGLSYGSWGGSFVVVR